MAKNKLIEKYKAYLQNNPEGYWFKRKLYGWGWIPVRWQGWLVVVISTAVILLGAYIGETDDAPGAILLGAILGIALLFGASYWKGEKPRWQWGFPKDKEG